VSENPSKLAVNVEDPTPCYTTGSIPSIPSIGGSSDPYKKANYDAAYLLPHPFLPTQSTPHQMHHQKVAMPVAKCAKLGGGAKYVTRNNPPKKNRDDINARTRYASNI